MTVNDTCTCVTLALSDGVLFWSSVRVRSGYFKDQTRKCGRERGLLVGWLAQPCMRCNTHVVLHPCALYTPPKAFSGLLKASSAAFRQGQAAVASRTVLPKGECSQRRNHSSLHPKHVGAGSGHYNTKRPRSVVVWLLYCRTSAQKQEILEWTVT